MSKQHYQVSTYKAQSSVGYLMKRAHSLMMDVMEPLFEGPWLQLRPVRHSFLAARRIAVNPKGHLCPVPSRQRCTDPRDRSIGGARPAGACAPRSRSPQS